MTVSIQTPFNSSTGNGVTTVFPYTFKIITTDDLKVTVNGVLQSIGTNYTVSGVGAASGNVTFLSPPANGAIVVRYSDTLMKRDTDYQQNGDFLESVVDADFDRLWLGLRDTTSKVDRAFRAPPGETFVDLPNAATRASRLLGFDSDGDPALFVLTDLDGVVVTAFASTLLADGTEADARATLGVAAAANGVHTGTTTMDAVTMDAATINGGANIANSVVIGTDPAVGSARTLQVVNTDTGAASSTSSYVQTNAGLLQLVIGSIAGGGTASILCSATGVFNIYTTQAQPLQLGSNNRPDDVVITSAGVVLTGGTSSAPTGYTTRGDVAIPAARGVRAKNTLKAWVNFDGTAASPITPRDHFNVASITKHAAGDYTCNLTAGIFADANYSAVGTAGSTTAAGFYTFRGPVQTTPTATAYRCRVSDSVPNYLDVNHICVQFAGA